MDMSPPPPPALKKSEEGTSGFVPPPPPTHTFRHQTTPQGTDCQTKSAFLLPIKMISITVYRTFYA